MDTHGEMSDSSNHQYSSGTEFEAARLRTHNGYGKMTQVCKLGRRAKILNCKLAQESTVASSGFNPVGSLLYLPTKQRYASFL